MKKIFGLIAVLLTMAAFIPGPWAQDNWQNVTNSTQIFEKGYIQVTGMSGEGQSRYKAFRAATVVAQRDLLEIIEGVRLSGETTVKDGMLQSDNIRTSVNGFLRGAIKCGEKYHENGRYAEVCMKIHIRGKGSLYDVILPLIKEEKIQKVASDFPSNYYTPDLVPKVIGTEAVPETLAEPSAIVNAKIPDATAVIFDGLIVDLRDFQFRPAIVNTVLTEEDKIVFDPSKILSAILVERGCGGFTTDMNKARALLESWGSKKPMTVKGIGVVKMTNAKISANDAAAIYISDQKNNLLAQAKVVFLLK